MLPEIADGLHVPITTAGLLVSGYALGVVVGAPVVTVIVVRLERKPVLLGLLSLSVAGNLLSGVAGSYGVLMGGRIDLVAPKRKARAIAGMFMGITLANLVGVPLGALIGQHLGWRAPFLCIAAAGAISIFALGWLVPPTGEGEARSVRAELKAFTSPGVWLALAMTAFGFGAVYCPLTYVVPLMTSVAGFSRSDTSWLLVLFGAGLTVGNLAGARAADHDLMATLRFVLLGLTVMLLVFAETSHQRVAAAVTLFGVGAFAYATVPGFTARVINSAGSAGSTLASSAAVAAFNLGNAAGAYLGGVALSIGHSPADTSYMGAGMAAVGLAAAVLSVALDRRRPQAARWPPPETSTPTPP